MHVMQAVKRVGFKCTVIVAIYMSCEILAGFSHLEAQVYRGAIRLLTQQWTWDNGTHAD